MIKTSFIIIAYNEERVIARCLDAILAQNNLVDYEIVVVDDGSKDRTAHIVGEYTKKNPNIVLHCLVPNQGRGAARAAGITLAQGEYFAFIDADIVLPPHWLTVCLGYMSEYDAVGGMSVPDGDVNYIYGLLNIKPKVVDCTVAVSGSNGLYKQKIFQLITFNKELRDGEDSVFNKAMTAKGFKIFSIKSLIAEHKESRRFGEALKWLYQTGRGATRQFKQFKEFRLPDLAYFGLMGLTIITIVLSVLLNQLSFLSFPLLYVFLVDIIHFQRKFFFEFHRPLRYFAGIAVYWVLLVCYFAGRTAGWFMPIPKEFKKKKVMVCFDFEGQLGMPFHALYDITKTTHELLRVLKTYHVKAVFFVVGKITEEHPDLIKKIADEGYEIALHGYEHEHMDKLTEKELVKFGANLAQVGNLLEKITGKRPKGFRAPFLEHAAPNALPLSNILKQQGYVWTSNQSIRHEREFLKPGRLPFAKFLMMSKVVRTLLYILLNWRFVVTGSVGSTPRIRIFANLQWLLNGASPFSKNGLIEIHAHAPFDCEMVGLPRPDEPTQQILMDYAVDTLIKNVYEARGGYNITFHDWIVGSNNRTQILERVLSALSKDENITFVLPDELI